MKHSKQVTNSKNPARALSHAGASSSSLLIALLVLVAAGGVGAWLLLGRGASTAVEPKKPAAEKVPEPAPLPEPAVAAEAPPGDPAEWNEQMKKAGDAPVTRTSERKRTAIEGETVTLEGDVVDADTNEPVYFAWIYLIPPDRGDVVTASKGWTPSRFRNGHFTLARTPIGTYNVLCESREHEAWTGTIKVPYDGHWKIRLKRGTAIEGIVRDVNQMPIEGIDVQLVVDLQKIDGGANPPMGRLCKTDKLGHYSFNKLPAGSYGLQATLTSDVLATEPEFRVDPRATVRRDFALPRLGTLKLTVKNVADQPVSRARVSLTQERDGRDRPVRTTYSDIKGVARVEFVRPGNYKLRVQMQGFEDYVDQVTVAGGEESREVPVLLKIAAKSGN